MKYIQPDWPAPANVRAYTTLRTGWQGRYSGDNIAAVLNLPEQPVWLKQTHSDIVLEATSDNIDKIGDASYTSTPNRVCLVLTADCLPVLITNKEGTTVAAVHAGWRGLAAGIIEKTIATFEQPANELLVWLGPAISARKFEVGRDVYDVFTQQHAESAQAFVPHAENKWLGNLYELARIRLRLKNINQIYGGDYCTFIQEDMFYSFRRDKENCGRMASVIWIDG